MPTPPRKTSTQKTGDETVKPLDEQNLRHQIEQRAYAIWLSSGCSQGNDVAHWLRAEKEVLAGRPEKTGIVLLERPV